MIKYGIVSKEVYMPEHVGGATLIGNDTATINKNLFPDTFRTNTFGVIQERSIDSIITNSQTTAGITYVGIIAKENPSYKSGYEVAAHVEGNVTLIVVNTETKSKDYIPLNLGPKKEEGGQPGINLVEIINKDYPELEVLVTGQNLLYGGNLKNSRNDTATGDIDEIIKNYTKLSAKEIKELIREIKESSEGNRSRGESKYGTKDPENIGDDDRVIEETAQPEYFSSENEAECVEATADADSGEGD